MPAEPDRPEKPKARKKHAKGSGVFISYRREDASGYAGRLHRDLTLHFGPGGVFRDVDTINPGVDFHESISTSLESCGAFVVVIGREWLVDLSGRRRLEEPGDWVRMELETALTRDDVLVVPVRVEGAAMPAAKDLPESLAELVRINSLEIHDSGWDDDVKRLIECLEAVVGPPRLTWPARVRRLLIPKTALGTVTRVLATAAVIVALVWGLLPRFETAPRTGRMTGDYNIAVAEFESVDANGRLVDSPEADDLAQSVYDVLDRELESIEQGRFDVSLRAPAETGPIRGSTPDQRAEVADREAKRIKADVVVYGTLRADVPNEFAAEFFLSDRLLQNAEELFGQHELGSVIKTAGDISRNPVIRSELREQILGRARALAEFIVGLAYYGANQYETALEHFEAARVTEGWADSDGKEVLYLFLGNVTGKLDDLDKAGAFYDKALELSPEYARAQLGRAEVLLHKSRGNCEAGNVNVDGLTAALDTYRRARSATIQPALSDIPFKVVFGEGRVHLCLSQALVGDFWADAEREFQQVIDEFRKGNVRVREMAGESYADLGFAHLPAAGDPGAPDRFRQAAADYQSAIDVSGDNDRKAFFSSMRGFILGRLGDVAKATEAYDLAIRLAPDPADKATYEQARQALTAPPPPP